MEDEKPGIPGYNTQLSGPWFSTQLTLSLTIGLSSFFWFCIVRRIESWKVLYAPRTLLSGFSPHEVHLTNSLFGWILPTIRASEFTVLHIVGLDAAVLLAFLRTGFYFFFMCSILAWTILVPINYQNHGSSDGIPDNSTIPIGNFTTGVLPPVHNLSHASFPYLVAQLAFTYIFTILAFYFLKENYAKYIPMRQLFSLQLASYVPARTILVTDIPRQLRTERALVEYFETIHSNPTEDGFSGLKVETVDLVRSVSGLDELIRLRTEALLEVERAWERYLSNPVPVEGPRAVFGYYAPEEVQRILDGSAQGDIDDDASETPNVPEGQLIDVESPYQSQTRPERGLLVNDSEDVEARLLTPSHSTIINPSRDRPKIKVDLCGPSLDALEYYADRFRVADKAVRDRRRGKFHPTSSAFVTFETIASAQIAAQTVHYPIPGQLNCELAPEPRDIHWYNLSLSKGSVFIRRLLVIFAMIVILSAWAVPVSILVDILTWGSKTENIKKYFPKLAQWLKNSPRLNSLLTNSLPSLGMVIFNNLLPLLLEGLSTFQGLAARSWIEYSLLKKYHVSIHFTTILALITLSTISLLQELSENPAKLFDKLASTLPGDRNFFVSYVMLAGIAFMPLQLVQLNILIPRFFSLLGARTPRDHAELNAPPTVNLGVIYPQALLIFTVGITYSIIMPLILPFAALYFGISYVVFKYKFLFVYYRPFESRGQAWPLAFNRMAFALMVFQIFQLSLFTVRKAYLITIFMIPLMVGTTYYAWWLNKLYKPLSTYVNVSQASQTTLGNTAGELSGGSTRRRHRVTPSQAELQWGRYVGIDEGVYVVRPNPATDYSQPPMLESYFGVLNTGRRRYKHPALSGSLPDPWLPKLSEPSSSLDLSNFQSEQTPRSKGPMVMNLRRKWSNLKRAAVRGANAVPGVNIANRHTRNMSDSTSLRGLSDDDPSRAWRGSQISSIEEWDETVDSDDEEEEEEGAGLIRYGTYWPHRPNRSQERYTDREESRK